MKTAAVSLGRRSYEIWVGAGLMACFEDLWEGDRFEKAVLMTDSNVERLFADPLTKQLQNLGSVDRLVVEPGEASKSWTVAGKLLDDLAALQFGRRDLIVTLGGGVVSDLGAFVASTYLRGIRVMHIPTTLLGQVDAAIGGKTGVNLSAGKNLAGTFYQPCGVICDVDALATLPEPEFRSGMAEVIKYGLCFDPEILSPIREGSWSDFEPGRPGPAPIDSSALEDLVFKCAAIKARVVSEDETDNYGRLVLNYGHTFGHALEAAGGFKRWSHGEAISVGMMFAAHLAMSMGLIDADLVALHREVLERTGLPVRAAFDPDQVERLWMMDKKRATSQRWVLLEDLGKPVVRSDAGASDIETAMKAVAD